MFVVGENDRKTRELCEWFPDFCAPMATSHSHKATNPFAQKAGA
jgi:hypothetical protein